MTKITQIAEGYANLAKSKTGLADPGTESLASLRWSYCQSCPLLQLSNKCKKCGCYMPSKVRSVKAKCPTGKW